MMPSNGNGNGCPRAALIRWHKVTVVKMAIKACAMVTVVIDFSTSTYTGCPNFARLAVLPRYAVVAYTPWTKTAIPLPRTIASIGFICIAIKAQARPAPRTIHSPYAGGSPATALLKIRWMYPICGAS